MLVAQCGCTEQRAGTAAAWGQHGGPCPSVGELWRDSVGNGTVSFKMVFSPWRQTGLSASPILTREEIGRVSGSVSLEGLGELSLCVTVWREGEVWVWPPLHCAGARGTQTPYVSPILLQHCCSCRALGTSLIFESILGS